MESGSRLFDPCCHPAQFLDSLRAMPHAARAGESALNGQIQHLRNRYSARADVDLVVSVRQVGNGDVELIQPDVARSEAGVSSSGRRLAETNGQVGDLVLPAHHRARRDGRRDACKTDSVRSDRLTWFRGAKRHAWNQSDFAHEGEAVLEKRYEILPAAHIETPGGEHGWSDRHLLRRERRAGPGAVGSRDLDWACGGIVGSLHIDLRGADVVCEAAFSVNGHSYPGRSAISSERLHKPG